MTKRINRRRRQSGFTLIEALISLVLLAAGIAVMTLLFTTGLQAYSVQSDNALLDGALRSRMEMLLSESFSGLASGSEAITVNGTPYTVTWTVSAVDIDGDSAPEANVKSVEVDLAGRTLDTLVVDHGGRLSKL